MSIEPSGEELTGTRAAERATEVLERIATGLGLDVEVRVEEDAEEVTAEYLGDDLGQLIGHHGAVIDAIQHLTYRIVFHGIDERKRISVDAAGYRERRAQTLRALGDQAAESAVREQRPVGLEPMTASERRVVHEHLKSRFDVETYSEGQEPSRRLVVAPLVD
jgi:spoIIIJ-associated protein